MVGKTISHYQVLEKIGEGGMGVVYKARDAHLNRSVALKVLPPEKVADPERKRRFVQEAQSASALNHPNIVHIYDIDQQDGVDYIAMEHVDGKTLDQVIPRHGMRLNEALKCAVQIADALAAAHAVGIIHRDLKPGNVMVTDKGQVKVLDFGLAKLTELTGIGKDATTRTMKPTTEEGTILGTVSYMSPEQAQGKPVDARTDIFNLGATLYEMVTGQRAFRGDSKISTLGAIIHKDPPPLGAEVPHELANLINRCLRKDPRRRFQHMDDLKVALEDLKEESESGALGLSPAPLVAQKRRGLLSVGIVAIVVVAAAAAWFFGSRQAGSETETAYRLIQITKDSGITTSPSISPDGKLLAYSSDRAEPGNMDIWVQQVAGGGAIRLTKEPVTDGQPSFSPDGSNIVYTSGSRGVFVVPALGGQPPQRIAAFTGSSPRFSPDGKRVAFGTYGGTGASRLYIAGTEGGGPQVVPLKPESFLVSQALWSPDGRNLLLYGDPTGRGLAGFGWYAVSVEGGEPVLVSFDKERAAELARRHQLREVVPFQWTEDGRIVFVGYALASANIWDRAISGDGRQLGPARRLTSGTGEYQPSVSRDGKIAFSSGTDSMNLFRLPLEPNSAKVSGSLERVTHGNWGDALPFASEDGKSVVFVSTRNGTADVWIRDVASGEDTPLVATASNEDRGTLSPDGSRVVFRRYEGEKIVIYARDRSGGPETKICENCRSFYNWAPDGHRLVFGAGRPEHLVMIDVWTGAREVLVADPERDLHDGVLSPDGQWLTFKRVMPQGAAPVFVAPLAGGTPVGPEKWIEVAEGGRIWWSPDGKLLYYCSNRDGYMCIWAQRLNPTRKTPVGEPFPVQHFHDTLKLPSGFNLVGYGMTAHALYMPLLESRINIWIAEPQPRK